MYDELVKELRDSAEWADRLALLMGRAEGDTHAPIMRKAADAIEELQKAVNFHKFNSELWEDKYNSLADEKWIPVTERLPKENAPCIVYNKDYGPMVGWRVDGERFRIPGSRFPDHPTHWMPLPETPKEE